MKEYVLNGVGLIVLIIGILLLETGTYIDLPTTMPQRVSIDYYPDFKWGGLLFVFVGLGIITTNILKQIEKSRSWKNK